MSSTSGPRAMPILWHRGVTGVSEEAKFFVEKNVGIPMRDGVHLISDIHLPSEVGASPLAAYAQTLMSDSGMPEEFIETDVDAPDVVFDTKVPCVLIRTPYNKSKVHPDMRHPALYWVQNGYACVIQDVRGRFKSSGHFFKYINEAADGYDTVQWLAQQPWCTGQVCTFGVSYLAHVQAAMACLAPPNLTAMFVVKGGFYDAITSGIRQGGAFEARQWLWAMKNVAGSHEEEDKKVSQKTLTTSRAVAWMNQYPFQRGDSPLSAADPDYEKYVFDFATRSSLSPYWRRPGLSIVQARKELITPALFLSGWYDIYARSSVELYDAFCKSVGRDKCRLILGPWLHTGSETHYAGEVDFGIQATLENSVAPSRYALACAWFDIFTKRKGKKDSAEALPAVLYYRMGGGEGHKTAQNLMFHGGLWLASESFPPATAIDTVYLLEAGRLRVPSTSRASAVRAVAKRRRGPITPATVVQWHAQHTSLHSTRASSRLDDFETSKPRTPTPAGITLLSDGSAVPSSLCSRFLFDPMNPFPSIGGNISPFKHLCMPGAYNQVHRTDHAFCRDDGLHGVPLAARRDVLAFRTRPLQAAVDVTGTPSVTLFVSSSCVDTDFYAMLVDECPPTDDYPDGFRMNITHGIVRCSLRDAVPTSTAAGVQLDEHASDDDLVSSGELLQPESVYCVEITMYPTSNLFGKGHRIAVYVTSSAYPHFDVNPNTGSAAAGGGSKITRVAENTVWHTHALPSHIVLPVVQNSPCAPPQFVPLSDAPTDDSGNDDDNDDNDDDNYDSIARKNSKMSGEVQPPLSPASKKK